MKYTKIILLSIILVLFTVIPVSAAATGPSLPSDGYIFQDLKYDRYTVSVSTSSLYIPIFRVTQVTSPTLAFSSAAEPTVIRDPFIPTSVDAWNGGAAGSNLFYRNTSDITLTSWSSPTTTNLPTGYAYFTYIIYDNTTSKWYLFGSKLTGSTFDMYLFNSTNKVTWNIMNGGNPVLVHNSNPASKYYYVFNPAIYITGTRFNMLFEADTQAGADNFAALLYTYSDLTEMNWTAHINTTPILPLHGNPDLTYIPSKRMLMCTSGNWSTGTWFIDTFYADISSGFTDLTTWTKDQGNFNISQNAVHEADPSVVIMGGTPSSTNIAIVYLHNQGISSNGDYVEMATIT